MDAPIILHIDETVSTNSYLKELSSQQELSNGFTIYADFQTAGRGQRGNSWESAKGENLTFSTILLPDRLAAEDQFLISQIVSLSIKEVLAHYVNDITIKWPNDIYWKDKKITGILIENEIQGEYLSQSILGVGINVNQQDFFSNAPNPVSLNQITGKVYDVAEVLTQIIDRLLFYNSQLVNVSAVESIREAYKKSLYRREGLYRFSDGQRIFLARIKDVEDIGLLVLETEKGEVRSYGFKEIKYLFD